ADVLTVDGVVRVGKYATHERFSEVLGLFLAVNPFILYEGNGLRPHDVDLFNCSEKDRLGIISEFEKRKEKLP
ncbi:MAG: hypothetical protein FWG68_00255, partial [Defluviitaleaceae bacterium]|nr:hypothetical protein [Defluviitaleaceae bacterium]